MFAISSPDKFLLIFRFLPSILTIIEASMVFLDTIININMASIFIKITPRVF